MTTPPRVTDQQVAAAIARIIRRHRGTDHPGQHLLSDDPREVLLYLRLCGSGRLMGDHESHDVEDGLTLRLALWWEGELAEYRLLDAAERLGLNRRRVGAVLGISTGQGLLDRRDRKQALFGPSGVPNEKTARADRQPDPTTTRTGDDTPLRAFLGQLLALRDELPEDIAEDVTWLRQETTDRAEMGSAELAAAVQTIVNDLKAVEALPDSVRRAVARVATRLPAGREHIAGKSTPTGC